jgi:uncharacterized membrane protein
MKKRATVPVILLVLAVVSIALIGCRGHGPRRGDPERKVEFMINRLKVELNLSEEQVKLLKDIQQQIREKIQDVRPEFKEHSDFLKEQILKDSLDLTQIKEYMDAQQNKHKEIRDFILTQIKRFHDTLTQSQKEKLASLLEEFQGAWYNHHRF